MGVREMKDIVFTCKDCHFFQASSVSKNTGERFCTIVQYFVVPASKVCKMFRYSFSDGWICASTGRKVSPYTCLVCGRDTCDRHQIALKYLRLKKTLRRSGLPTPETIKDIRSVLQEAIYELNRSHLSPKYVYVPKGDVSKLSDEELCEVVDSFLNAVELIPTYCEPDIPDKVVGVYNDIVSATRGA